MQSLFCIELYKSQYCYSLHRTTVGSNALILQHNSIQLFCIGYTLQQIPRNNSHYSPQNLTSKITRLKSVKCKKQYGKNYAVKIG